MRKAFTLVELLAVIVTLAIILAIAIPNISSIIDDVKLKTYIDNEDMMVRVAKAYVGIYDNYLPSNLGDTTEIKLSDLQSNNYINTITDPKDNSITCDGYVLITKTDTNVYDYAPYLKCGDGLISNGYINDGLVAYWKLDNNTYDYTPNNKIGTMANITTTANRFGTLNKAMNFNGVNSSIIISNNSIFNFNSFSIIGWYNYRDYTYPKTFLAIKKSFPYCYETGGKGWDFGHGFKSNGVDVCIADGTHTVRNTLVFNNDSIPSQLQNKWVNIVLIVDRVSNVVKAYINGIKQSMELDISSVTGDITNASDISIGVLYGWQTDGIIDDLRIYNRVLSANEVKHLYDIEKNISR